MVDGPNQEEEYQFDGIDTEQYQGEHVAARTRISDSEQMRKRVFMVAGALLIIVIGYQMFGLLVTEQKPDPQKITASIDTPTIPVSPSVIEAPKFSDNTADQQMLEDVKVQYGQTKTELVNMSALLTELRKTLGDMDSRLVDLNYTQKQLADELNTQKQALTKLKKHHTKTSDPVAKRTIYFVKAVIRGRAWLKSENESTLITVKVGEQLPGYGKIAKIDHDTGEVITRKGEIITFSPDDR